MSLIKVIVTALLLAGCATVLVVQKGHAAPDPKSVEMVVYEQDGCSHCISFRLTIRQVQRNHPELHVIFKNIAIDRYRKELEDLGTGGTPTFIIHGQVHGGEVSAAELESYL